MLFVLLALSWAADAQPLRALEARRAAAATAWLEAHLYIREQTGDNDGPDVWALIREGGGEPRSAWCGFTQRKVQAVLGLPFPDGAGGSYNWFLLRSRHTYYIQGQCGTADSIRVGHCVGIYSARRGRIAHITRAVALVPPLRKGRAPRAAYCIGGNEGSGPRAGIHRTLYPLSSIYALSNWLN